MRFGRSVGGKSPHWPEVCSDAVVRVRANIGRSDARVCAYYDLRAGFFLYDFTPILILL